MSIDKRGPIEISQVYFTECCVRVSSLLTDCPIKNQNSLPDGAATNVKLDPTTKSTGLIDWGDDGQSCDCGDGSTVADADVKWQIVGTSLTLYINSELKEAGSLDKLPVPGLIQLGSCGTNRSSSPYAVFGLYATSSPVVNRNPGASPTGLSPGAIAGIVIGCLVGVILLGLLTWFIVKKRKSVVKSTIPSMTLQSQVSDRNVFDVQPQDDSQEYYNSIKEEKLGEGVVKEEEWTETPTHSVPGSYLNS